MISRTRIGLAAMALATTIAGCSRQEPAPEPIRAVRSTVIGSSEARNASDYAADVRARTESRLGFRVGGKLVTRPADLGDTVKAGQVLATLDAQVLRLGEASAQAALAGAQSGYKVAEADFKRFQELRRQGFISEAELQRHQAELDAARSSYQQARAQSQVQGNQAAYAKLTATAAGVITAVEAEPGAVVAAGTPIVRLAHDGPRDVVFNVPEDRLPQIRALAGKAGALKVELWGATGAPLPATVREVAAAADPTTRTFLVKADIGKADARLGQTATVTIENAAVSGVVKLPLSAVMGKGGQSSVWLVDAGTMTVKQQPVQVAGAQGNEVVIAAGLSPGQRVVTAGAHVLTPGQKVKLFDEAAVREAAAPASAPR
jgi:membrane fusion protein, multidrug efflux system